MSPRQLRKCVSIMRSFNPKFFNIFLENMFLPNYPLTLKCKRDTDPRDVSRKFPYVDTARNLRNNKVTHPYNTYIRNIIGGILLLYTKIAMMTKSFNIFKCPHCSQTFKLILCRWNRKNSSVLDCGGNTSMWFGEKLLV